jgi:uridine kinase
MNRLVYLINRGRDVESILYQYNFFVKSSFDEFVEPTINYADIVVPSTKPNQVAIRFIVSNLKNMIEEYKNIKVYLN